ncbi:MAG: site-specific DNA-methyltransferase [Chloroflexi bacterium]|nr:site-specific DNA-methyltransferase [Chloroflexota bacterium]
MSGKQQTNGKIEEQLVIDSNTGLGSEAQADYRTGESVDSRNRLNDLTNKEWMISTKSVWKSEATSEFADLLADEKWQAFIEWLVEKRGKEGAENVLEQLLPSVIYSQPPARDDLKSQHPATFAESDIEKLILFFTKQGQRVLDPFVGVGSTLVACKTTDRYGVGIELGPRWAEIARKRVKVGELPLFQGITIEEKYRQQVIEGDAREIMHEFDDESFDFIVTSPPYWKILHKNTDHKVIRERIEKGLETRYSELEADLGNIGSYTQFLRELQKVFMECYRVLRTGKYMCVIVSDFRDRGEFIAYHSDISDAVEECDFTLQGITILVQDSKNLYPYGIPYAFVSNINHQYILVFRKKSNDEK